MDYKKILDNAKKDRMEEAVQTAAQMLLEQDIDDIKMNDIAVKCDIGVASLYRYFGTKSAIVIRAGCLLWGQVKALFDGVFECDYYKNKTGIDQIRELMKVFKVLYSSHKDFLRFIDSFDRFVIREKIPQEELAEYERSVMDFFPLFEDAYRNGCEDGTARPDADFRTLYISVTHALMLMSEKFARGDVFMGESKSAEKELDYLIEMAITSIEIKEEHR